MELKLKDKVALLKQCIVFSKALLKTMKMNKILKVKHTENHKKKLIRTILTGLTNGVVSR